MLVGLHR